MGTLNLYLTVKLKKKIPDLCFLIYKKKKMQGTGQSLEPRGHLIIN